MYTCTQLLLLYTPPENKKTRMLGDCPLCYTLCSASRIIDDRGEYFKIKAKKKAARIFTIKICFRQNNSKTIYTETPSASQHRESFQYLVWLDFPVYLFANHSCSCLSHIWLDPTRNCYEHESSHILVNFFCNANTKWKKKKHLSTLQPVVLRGKQSWPCANHLEAAC